MRRRRAIRWTLLALALPAIASGCASAPARTGAAADERACWPALPYRDGWLGGDGAWSVPLGGGRSLWLFGDSFVGAPDARHRVGAHFLHNAAAISTCHPDGRLEVAYAWRYGDGDAPLALFESEVPGHWLWPFGGFAHAGRLYVGLLEVEPAPPQGPLAVPFRIAGTAIAEIREDPASPAEWKPRLLTLSRGGGAVPLAATVVHGAFVYLFAFLERGDTGRPRFLARLPLAALDAADPDLPAALETWGRDGRWHAGLEPDTARILMEDDATEMSVVYHPEAAKWLALYAHPGVGASFPETRPDDAVWARTADALEGPWSAPRAVFRIPELAPGRGDRHTACYAAKEQPQFSRPGSATFTYVCNLFAGSDGDPYAVLRRLQTRMDLYRPIPAAVSVPVPDPGP